jgi:hypothetical protein
VCCSHSNIRVKGWLAHVTPRNTVMRRKMMLDGIALGKAPRERRVTAGNILKLILYNVELLTITRLIVYFSWFHLFI